MDRLAVMRAFCRIVERGSFARAAEDLGVSPGLLSRDIKRLEQHLGCALLTRTTRRMALTEQGRLYYAESRRLLEEVEQVEDRVREHSDRVRGRLRINAPQSFGLMVLSQLLPGFMERYPEVEVSLALEDRVVDMVEGGFDLSIRVRATLPDSSLIARRIAPVRQRLFASPAYLATHGTPQIPEELAAHEAVSYLLADDASHWTLQGPDGAVSVPCSGRLEVGSSLMLQDMLIAGLGIGALPDFISDQAETAGQLERVLPAFEIPTRQVYAVTASRLGTDAKTLAFLDYLKERLGS
ncbi:LysR family transcriptional regulator [Halomonas sp. YLGW01]|uniref:LysR family transcriptional regulator n=1 Tax=Halomonas sp. YLGW01 TaxID=2773308 RepID=UPI001F5BED97|nr:LysR family transcriptional regulator [Halomonas sp. YLGW01]